MHLRASGWNLVDADNAQVDDGMYDPKRHNVPIPDLALGGHVMPLRAGTIGYSIHSPLPETQS